MASDDDDFWADLGDQSVLLEVAKAEAAFKVNSLKDRQMLLVFLPIVPNIQDNSGESSMHQLQQKDLFGNIVKLKQNTAKSAPWQSKAVAGPSTSANPPVKDKVNAVVRKQWDQTKYVKSGAISKKKPAKKPASKSAKGKGKARAYDDDLDDEEDDFSDAGSEGPLSDAEEAAAPPKPMKLQPDREACKTFTYPLNKPLRKYQYDIVTKAFYTDTLVALPTGLGKTFLAATIMLNYYRWFPEGKIIFMAPSRPLVTQQIQACHGIAGIPLKDAVELTGKDAPEKRQEEWSKRRVFYCTPQTVKNDLFKKKLDPTEVVCIVVDEAHKATGDYGTYSDSGPANALLISILAAYTEVVRYMMRKNPHFRLLALTATPGSNSEVVQSVIDNLHVGRTRSFHLKER
jgi:ATP-dependent DNA helicase MPH1